MKDIFTAAEYEEMEAIVAADEARGINRLLEDLQLVDIEEDEAMEYLASLTTTYEGC